jgi:hypothetical protein
MIQLKETSTWRQLQTMLKERKERKVSITQKTSNYLASVYFQKA